MPIMIRLGVVAALLLAGATGVWYGLAAPRIELAEQLQQQAEQLANVRAEQLRTQQQHADRLDDVHKQLSAVQTAITTTAAHQRQQLEALRRADQQTREYLDAAVPAAVGWLYSRAGGTDPGAYRQPASLPADPVPAAGAAAAAGQR